MTASTQQVYLPLQFQQVLEIVKQLGITERQNLLLFLLGLSADKEDVTLTHFASEQTLAKSWLTETEDAAWQNL